jgi:hypothetical protein
MKTSRSCKIGYSRLLQIMAAFKERSSTIKRYFKDNGEVKINKPKQMSKSKDPTTQSISNQKGSPIPLSNCAFRTSSD